MRLARTNFSIASGLVLASGLALAACGEVTNHLPDGPPAGGDGGPGADVAPPQPVTATVFSPNGERIAIPGVQVVFVEPNGMRHRVVTDNEGIASAVVPAGSSVSAVWLQNSNYYQIETVQNVSPGDHINLVGTNSDYTLVGQVNISYPAQAGVSYYYVYGPCGSWYAGNTTSIKYDIRGYCAPKDGKMTISVTPRDPNGQVMGYIDMVDVAYTDGMTVNLSGTYRTLNSFTATYTNLDAQVAGYISMSRYVAPRGYSTGDGQQITTTMTTLTGTTPTSTAPAFVQTTLYDNMSGQQRIYQKLAGNSLAYNLDVRANLLAFLGYPTLDPMTRKITTPTSTTTPYDAAYARVYYSHHLATDAGPQGIDVSWSIVGPSLDGFTLPDLGPEVGDFGVAVGDDIYNGQATILESEGIASYDVVKPDFFLVLYDPFAALGLASDKILRISETNFD